MTTKDTAKPSSSTRITTNVSNNNPNDTIINFVVHVILFTLPLIIVLVILCTKKCVNYINSNEEPAQETQELVPQLPESQNDNNETTSIQFDDNASSNLPPAYTTEMKNNINFENLPSYEEVQESRYSSNNYAFISDIC